MNDPVQEQGYSAAKSLLIVSIQQTTASGMRQQQQLEDNTPAEECNQNHENKELVVNKKSASTVSIPAVLVFCNNYPVRLCAGEGRGGTTRAPQ